MATGKSARQGQDQRSLKDQLDTLEKLAVENGLYDAHDWLLARRGDVREASEARDRHDVPRTTGTDT